MARRHFGVLSLVCGALELNQYWRVGPGPGTTKSLASLTSRQVPALRPLLPAASRPKTTPVISRPATSPGSPGSAVSFPRTRPHSPGWHLTGSQEPHSQSPQDSVLPPRVCSLTQTGVCQATGPETGSA